MMKDEDLRMVLFVSNADLPIICRACYAIGWNAVEAYSIDISIVAQSLHILGARFIAKEMDALSPPMCKSILCSNNQPVFSELVKNSFKMVHSSITPKASKSVHDLVSEKISDKH